MCELLVILKYHVMKTLNDKFVYFEYEHSFRIQLFENRNSRRKPVIFKGFAQSHIEDVF